MTAYKIIARLLGVETLRKAFMEYLMKLIGRIILLIAYCTLNTSTITKEYDSFPARKKIINKFTDIKDPSQGVQIGVVEISGTIRESTEICLELQALREDPSIKAILLIINSGGGSSGHSAAIAQAIKHCKKKKPIIAYIPSSGCSGAYWIATEATKIIAGLGSITGSIGVLLGEFRLTPTEYYDGLHKGEIEYDPIIAGKFKDAANPHKELTGDERDYLQDGVDEMYDLFCDVIRTNRKLKDDREVWADGKVFNAPTALKLGLIDQIGSLTDALMIIKKVISKIPKGKKMILVKLITIKDDKKNKDKDKD